MVMRNLEDYDGLLRKYDDSHFIEYPAGFDLIAAQQRFSRLAQAMAEEIGTDLSVESGVAIQDASYHGEISLPDRLKSDPETVVAVRISNFGSFASITGEEALASGVSERLLSLLSRHGYTFVPEWALDRDYDGSIPATIGIRTWWIRFFDYL